MIFFLSFSDKLLTSCGIQKMSVEEVALNKAMQQYAMEQQHNFQPTDPDAMAGENDTMSGANAVENTESECIFHDSYA